MGVFITSMLVYVFIGAKFLRLNAEDSLLSNIEQIGNKNGKSVINSPTSKSQDGFYIKVNKTSFFSKIQTLILSATHESAIRLPSAMPCIKEPERNQLKIVNVVSYRKCLCKHYKATPNKKNISINNSSKGSDILCTSCNTSAPLVVTSVKNVVTFMPVFKVAIPSNPQNSYERFKIKHTIKPNHINLNSNGIIVENQTNSNIYAAETVSFIEKNHSSGKDNSTFSISLFHSTSYPTTNNSSQKSGFSKPIMQNDISTTQTNSFVGKNNSDLFTKGDSTFSISQSGSTSNPRTDNSSRKDFSKPTSQIDIYVTQTDGFPRRNNSVSTLHLPTMFRLQKNMSLEKNISIMDEQYSQNTSYEVVKIKHTVLSNHTNFDSNGIIVENQKNDFFL